MHQTVQQTVQALMMLTLYKASKDPSRAFRSEPSRLWTQAVMSSGHVFKVPKLTMTAILVPTVCRRGLDGLRMQCSKDSCRQALADFDA